MCDFHFFDPRQDVVIVNKRLPHWAQAGTVCFITWRTIDSLPAAAYGRLAAERTKLATKFGFELGADWKREILKLPPADRWKMQRLLFENWDQQLNAGRGERLLATPEVSQIVAESLLHFDNERYLLTDFVVMPNHVHVLVAFAAEDGLLSQCTSWKRYTSGKINEITGRRGAFWQVEQFDHLVRSEEHFKHFRQYIADNPRRARLAVGSYRHYSKSLRA